MIYGTIVVSIKQMKRGLIIKMGKDKYSYVQGFCHLLHYNGLWCVKYNGTPGHYQKVEMACNCSHDNCYQECQVFNVAPDTIERNQEWRLRDHPL